MNPTIKFGVFDHLDASGLPLGDFYEHRLRLIEAYERIGIHCYHTAEHHATPLGMCPSPSVLHSAIAQRTKKSCSGRWSTRWPCTTRCASRKKSACSTT